MGIAYPRREDAVQYEIFDGTLESVQRIANLLSTTVTIVIEPRKNFQSGDTLRLTNFTANGKSIDGGDYVVRLKYNESKLAYEFESLSSFDFVAKYSKDGS